MMAETETEPPRRALVIEDEQDIRELMALHLIREGVRVDAVSCGEEALQKLQNATYPLYVIDWMLPGMSGVEITRTIRALPPERTGAILMVTARSEPADIVEGLEAGADDYLTKPFEVAVFRARVRALLRRIGHVAGRGPSPDEFAVGGVRILTDRHEVYCRDEKLSLTPSEFKLLVAMAQNRGKVLTRNQLIDLVQGEGIAVVPRAIDTHVFGLRKKLGGCADVVETIRGVGYRVVP